jgi:hypothetical protein
MLALFIARLFIGKAKDSTEIAVAGKEPLTSEVR